MTKLTGAPSLTPSDPSPPNVEFTVGDALFTGVENMIYLGPPYLVKRAGLFKFKIKFLDEPDFPALREHINEYKFSTDTDAFQSTSGGCLVLSCRVTADAVREARSLIQDNYGGIQIDFLDDSGNPMVSNVFRTRRGTIIPLQTVDNNNNSSQPIIMQLRFEDCAFSLWDLLPA